MNDNIEYQVEEYLIKHGQELIQDLQVLSKDALSNPILATYLNEAMKDEAIQHIAKALGLSYEDVATNVDEEHLMEVIDDVSDTALY